MRGAKLMIWRKCGSRVCTYALKMCRTLTTSIGCAMISITYARITKTPCINTHGSSKNLRRACDGWERRIFSSRPWWDAAIVLGAFCEYHMSLHLLSETLWRLALAPRSLHHLTSSKYTLLSVFIIIILIPNYRMPYFIAEHKPTRVLSVLVWLWSVVYGLKDHLNLIIPLTHFVQYKFVKLCEVWSKVRRILYTAQCAQSHIHIYTTCGCDMFNGRWVVVPTAFERISTTFSSLPPPATYNIHVCSFKCQDNCCDLAWVCVCVRTYVNHAHILWCILGVQNRLLEANRPPPVPPLPQWCASSSWLVTHGPLRSLTARRGVVGWLCLWCYASLMRISRRCRRKGGMRGETLALCVCR